MTLSQRVRELAAENRISETMIAIKTGVTPQTVKMWFEGTKEPYTSLIGKLAQVFGLSDADFLEGVDGVVRPAAKVAGSNPASAKPAAAKAEPAKAEIKESKPEVKAPVKEEPKNDVAEVMPKPVEPKEEPKPEVKPAAKEAPKRAVKTEKPAPVEKPAEKKVEKEPAAKEPVKQEKPVEAKVEVKSEVKAPAAPVEVKPAVKDPEPEVVAAPAAGTVADPLEALKATKFNTSKLPKKWTDNAPVINWAGEYAEHLKDEIAEGLKVLTGLSKMISEKAEEGKLTLSPDAIKIAERFDTLSDKDKEYLLYMISKF